MIEQSEMIVPRQMKARTRRGAGPTAQSGAVEVDVRGQVMGVFVARCEKRRAQLGLTYAALARRMGVSRAYVSRLMQGKQNSTVGSLLKLASALECDLGFRLDQRRSRGERVPKQDATHGVIVRGTQRMVRLHGAGRQLVS